MIVVTGGAGFIGSALIWGLNEKGREDILIVDQVENAQKWKNLVKRSFRRVLSIDSFFNWLSTRENAKKVTAIFHMGACSSTTERDMDFLLRNNSDYTLDLHRFCAQHKIPFIYASSAATYGDGARGFSDDHDTVKELRPINPYGYSKQLADLWILQEEKTDGFWCGLKFFNVYGPNEYHKGEMRSLIAKAYPQIKETGLMRLFKSYKEGFEHGGQKRDFIYVKDVVKMMLHIWEHHKEIPNGIYNIGTGKARTFKSLGQSVFKALGLKEDIEYIPMPEEIRNQYQYFTEAEMRKFLKNTGYKESMTELEDGVSDYVRNYLNTEDPYL